VGAAVRRLDISSGVLLVAVSGPLVPYFRRSATVAFLDGVNVASLALMAAASYQLGRAAIVDWVTVGLAIVGRILLLRFRIKFGVACSGGALVACFAVHRVESNGSLWQARPAVAVFEVEPEPALYECRTAIRIG